MTDTCISVIKMIISVAVWRIYPSWVNDQLRAWEGHRGSIMAGNCSLFQVFPEIIISSFLIISHQNFLSPQFEIEKKWSTKSSEQSGLKLENILSRIFGLITWTNCELTNAGWKNSMKSFQWLPPTTCTSTALFKRSQCTDTKLSFRTFRVERLWCTS